MMHLEDVKKRKGDSELASMKDKASCLDQMFQKLNSQINKIKEKQEERKRVLSAAIHDTKELG